MRYHANRHDADAFHAFVADYAAGDARLLLQACDIAANEGMAQAAGEVAKLLVSQGDNLQYGALYRATQFLAGAGETDLVARQLPRLSRLAQKRYQKEDLALMECSLAPGDHLEELEKLAADAMMDDVRAKAAKLLEDARK